ncbi:16S rRNA m(7)G-527 methyltransferase [Hydrogenoanaerobacterium saccharovorans]|uniref:Ribosomal RNA small subunit methyltransferase G n=1 Tax=Hydrogenoanaerobacterium saccharovorans TaxID=474960 RepID=A0A1H8CIK3_9FIRM|nr:16S rRNA (guanine(527)-N(7))-methyltransferase RsmG [Hydrogenoanaerobacterium saccharovorans]RPF43131.1 16S rRNA m(7)G-527 methyltransferase [Hydrogenoanaerobacterium saccharovorans]SEM94782.1 16S rRNA m(7)G-527 methyltransferase [Hydrogenoanaerobacterium saccharovorans]
MNIPKDSLKRYSADFGIDLDDLQLDKLELYANTLVEWNQKINLTAITEPNEIAVKHFLDSLLLLNAVQIPQNSSLIDVGTGAGFPSVPCKVVRGDIRLTMLDSLNKRINFLNALCEALGIESVNIHARAEEGGRNAKLREHFDIATARAVANLRELAEYCLPFVKTGGVFAALKGYDIDEELDQAKRAIKELGGKIVDVKKYILPDESKRSIVMIEKISQTPTKYPRQPAKIAKSPL